MSRDKNKWLMVDGVFSQFSNLKRPVFMGTSSIWEPPVDVYETDENIVIYVEIAGIEKDNMVCSISDMSLTIKGIRTEPTENIKRTYHRMEIDFGPFERHIMLPHQVNEENIRIDYSAGFLKITLEKKSFFYDNNSEDNILK